MSDHHHRRRFVFVVEDDALQARLLCRQLERLECEVLGPVASVQDALPLARDARIDAAILDMDLRGANSLPVAQALKARGIPFLFLTGFGSGEVPVGFGAVRRLAKPVEPVRLADALRDMFAHSPF